MISMKIIKGGAGQGKTMSIIQMLVSSTKEEKVLIVDADDVYLDRYGEFIKSKDNVNVRGIEFGKGIDRLLEKGWLKGYDTVIFDVNIPEKLIKKFSDFEEREGVNTVVTVQILGQRVGADLIVYCI